MKERLDFAHAGLITASFSAGFLTLNLLIYYLFYDITRQHDINVSLQLVNQRIEQDSTALKEASNTYKALRNMRHDMHNHIAVMDGLLRQSQYATLREYFQSVLQREQDVMQFLDCGRPAVNAILNLKIRYARELNISIAVKAAVPPGGPIADADLCALLGNILDNAIEACQSVENPFIKLDIRPQKGYLGVTCENSANREQLLQNPDLHTSKPDPTYHGLGVKIIRSIAAKYDGMVDMRPTGVGFTVKVLLANPEPADTDTTTA